MSGGTCQGIFSVQVIEVKSTQKLANMDVKTWRGFAFGKLITETWKRLDDCECGTADSG